MKYEEINDYAYGTISYQSECLFTKRKEGE